MSLNFCLNDFFNKGFYVYRNLLDKNEIKKIQESFYKKKNDIAKTTYFESDDQNCWDYIANARLLEILKYMLGEKIYYMHDLKLIEHTIDDEKGTWHRDSPCRRTGIGPDWDPKFPYNVVTTITYLTSSKDTFSSLNVIPGSHKTAYKNSLSNKIRFLHWGMKNKKKVSYIRNFIKTTVGKKIEYNPGDCIIFFANLYHMGFGTINNIRKNRQIIVSRFGGEGKHVENYLNYIFKHRKDCQDYIGCKKKDEFFNFLKKKNIYYPEPKKKIDIEGAFSNIKEY